MMLYASFVIIYVNSLQVYHAYANDIGVSHWLLQQLNFFACKDSLLCHSCAQNFLANGVITLMYDDHTRAHFYHVQAYLLVWKIKVFRLFSVNICASINMGILVVFKRPHLYRLFHEVLCLHHEYSFFGFDIFWQMYLHFS